MTRKKIWPSNKISTAFTDSKGYVRIIIAGENKMPIYEYRCNECQRRVNLYMRNMASTPQCPQCGSEELSRLFSTFAVRGTYKDIYEGKLKRYILTAVDHASKLGYARMYKNKSSRSAADFLYRLRYLVTVSYTHLTLPTTPYV